MFKSFAVRINNVCITKYNLSFWILASKRLARASKVALLDWYRQIMLVPTREKNLCGDWLHKFVR